MFHKQHLAIVLAFCLMCPGLVWAQGSGGASTSSGTSRAFNPAISLNGLFLISGFPGRPSHDHDSEEDVEGHLHEEPEGGIDVQEVELRFTAEIDPYSRADATLAFHGEEVHFEEIVVSSRVLGGGFGLRGGKFFIDASSENVLHTHEYPFVRRSLINEETFVEPYSDVGLELSYLFPFTSYIEWKAVVVDGKSEELFATGIGGQELQGGDLAYNTTLYTLFDLSESSTLGAAGRWLGGANDLGADTISQVAGASVVYRWVPTRTNRYKSLRLHGEYIYVDRAAETDGTGYYNGGWYGYIQYQFARRWWAQLRYDTMQRSFDEQSERYLNEDTRRSSIQLSFVPSEFQALRFEYSYVQSPDADWSEIFVQFNFTIGSHPAHRY